MILPLAKTLAEIVGPRRQPDVATQVRVMSLIMEGVPLGLIELYIGDAEAVREAWASMQIVNR